MNFEDFSRSMTILGDPLVLRIAVFAINLAIILFAEKLLSAINKTRNMKMQARVLRIAAVVFLLLHLLDIALVYSVPDYENYFFRIAISIAILFGCLVAFNLLSFFSRRKFGDVKVIDGEPNYFDSYNSRLVDLLGSVFIVLIAIYLVIVSWDMDSLLQTTGFIGIVFAFLALTNGIWAPDIYYGLVILNSAMLEDGDVVKLEDFEAEYIINRISFIHTNLLDVRSNHRVIIRNSQLIDAKVDNLSKRASTDGLRRQLQFNIGYPPVQSQDRSEEEGRKREQEEKEEQNSYAVLRRRIQATFDRAFEVLKTRDAVKINRNQPFELSLSHCGDFALTFTLSFYLEALPNTKVTRTIRQYLIYTPNQVQEEVNRAAVETCLVLATPVLIATHSTPKKAPRSQLRQAPGFMPSG
jgi:hypothetical protein